MAEQKQTKQVEKQTKKAKQEVVAMHVSNSNKAVRGRGRVFEGTVTKVFATRVVIEAERTVYNYKYERFFKKKMRMHSRLPLGMAVSVGDYIKVQECRPLSKIIHSIVIEVVRKSVSTEVKKSEDKK